MSEGGRLINLDGPRLGHVPAFDGFRGVFVMQVLLYHAQLTDWLGGSPIIIDWFFVGSGFLITSLLLDEQGATGSTDLRRFYQRRALRLFPAMYLAIAFVALQMLLAAQLAPDLFEDKAAWWVEPVAAATYSYYVVAAFMPDQLIGALGHTWSLTVEEHFYFLWPLLFMLAMRGRSRLADRRLVIGAVSFVVALIAARMLLHAHVVADVSTHEITYRDVGDVTWQGVVYRIAASRPDMIIYGCLLAIANKSIPRPLTDSWRRIVLVGGVLGWIGWVAFIALGNRVPGFDLFGGPAYQICLLLLGPMILHLYLCPESPPARFFSNSVLRYFGVRSYGIYLWHVPVGLFFLASLDGTYGIRRLVIAGTAVVFSVAAGVASYRFIERPFLRLKDRRFRRPQDDVTAASPGSTR